jgi:CHAD domain-containing protein
MTLSGEQPFGEAASAIIAMRSGAVFAHRRKAVLDIGEIEGVHQMRVATRRLRAALEVFGPCLDRKRGGRAQRDVKALADALGERRDRDVQLDLLARLHEDTEGPERHAVKLLIAELKDEQQEANAALADVLTQVKRSRLQQRLARLTRSRS